MEEKINAYISLMRKFEGQKWFEDLGIDRTKELKWIFEKETVLSSVNRINLARVTYKWPECKSTR